MMKIINFWDMMLCILVDHYQCFGGTCRLHPQGRRVNLVWKRGCGYGEREDRDKGPE
jgi:hypothetical protein